ncbi:MAG: lysophospholipid acyltransferase family protein [Bacteroidia bacterium]
MIYAFLKYLFRISLRVFFRNMQVKGVEHIPANGPLLFVSNHPNTILDPLTIACSIDRRVFFLAKAELFKSPFAKWLLPKFNMIPVYRAQDNPALMKNNDQTFTRCFDHLKHNNSILIFPEGISLTDRKLKKIKTGAARIALGAEALNDFKTGINIVCIGLNYSDHHSFQSDLFINIDEPILVKDYEKDYKQDAFEAVNILTDEIRHRLEKQIIAIEDAEIDRFVKNIEIIYKSQLLKDLGYSPKVKEQDFLVTKAINEQVQYFFNNQPDRVVRIKNNIDDYFKNLDRMELSDRVLKKFPGKGSLTADTLLGLFYMVIGFPVFVFGFANNFIPYKLPGTIARKIVPREFLGSVSMLLGTLTFLLFYGFQLWLVQHYFHNVLLTLCYLIALPLSGYFAFFYWKRFTNIRGRWIIFSLFYRKTALITSIINMRQNIIDELEKGRKEFAEMNAV